MKNKKYDFIVVGAGILGASLALELKHSSPRSKIALIDKEREPGQHQTKNNSGVIHSGIYYKPNSLKATNCIRGYNYLIEFCKKNNIKHKVSGKLIAGRSEEEEETLVQLLERSKLNGLKGVKMVNRINKIKEIEPNLNVKAALLVPQTGVVNFSEVLSCQIKKFIELGGDLICSTKIKDINEDYLILNGIKCFYDRLIATAGLQSDRLLKTKYKIIPFRGEYYSLTGIKKPYLNSMVYPTPNLDYPFLGVHFTRCIDNNIEVGPNALLAFAREKYKNKFMFDLKDTASTVFFSGFYKFLAQNKKFALNEFKKSFFINSFINEINSYFPNINSTNIKYKRSGIRAQLCNKNGTLIDDFVIEKNKNKIFVLNAPSPAATASISIAKSIVKNYVN